MHPIPTPCISEPETPTLNSADFSVRGRDDNLWGTVHGVDLLAEPREDKLGTRFLNPRPETRDKRLETRKTRRLDTGH